MRANSLLLRRYFSAKVSAASAPTRVVITHGPGSYVEGLIPLLQDLDVSIASTATPGRLYRTNGNVQKLTVAITVPVSGGFKAIAKRGSLAQEVFFTSAMTAEGLQDLLDKRLAQKR
jgi:hypothetical protein